MTRTERPDPALGLGDRARPARRNPSRRRLRWHRTLAVSAAVALAVVAVAGAGACGRTDPPDAAPSATAEPGPGVATTTATGIATDADRPPATGDPDRSGTTQTPVTLPTSSPTPASDPTPTTGTPTASSAPAPPGGDGGRPAAGCSLAPTGGLVRTSMPAGRSYLLSVPAGLTGREPTGVPLLVVLHGLRSQASQIANYAGFEDDAVRRGYVVAYPEGENGTWRFAADSPDVAFVRAVIEQVRTDRCIDAGRVFTSGHSLGAYLSQRMACDAGDLVRASTEYAGGPLTLVGGVCTPRRPISIGLFHGVDDRLVVIPLGRTSRDQWVQRDGCGPARDQGGADGTRTRFEPCRDGVQVTWHEYPGQNHLWPTGERRTQMIDEMWQLFDAAPAP